LGGAADWNWLYGQIQSGGSASLIEVGKNYFLSGIAKFIRKFNEIFAGLQIDR